LPAKPTPLAGLPGYPEMRGTSSQLPLSKSLLFKAIMNLGGAAKELEIGTSPI
jgi:hypothetical protein